jgi:hypothetical protein
MKRGHGCWGIHEWITMHVRISEGALQQGVPPPRRTALSVRDLLNTSADIG